MSKSSSLHFVMLAAEFCRAQQPAHTILILKRAGEKEFASNQQDLDTVWVQTLREKSQNDVAKRVQREPLGLGLPVRGKWGPSGPQPAPITAPSPELTATALPAYFYPQLCHSNFPASLQYSSAIFRQKACPALLCRG